MAVHIREYIRLLEISSTMQSHSSSSLVMPSHLIVLDVSGRKYVTQEITLQASPYFRNLLARWEHCSDKQEDGSYFIDADSDIFQHILDFMRRPSKYPLFWTKQTGFNYALYNKLEAEADYFLLHDLRDWLREKHYLDAVKTIVEAMALSEYELADRHSQRRYAADIEIQGFHGSYSGERRYRNPCAIHTEANAPARGCNYCEKLIRAHGAQHDDPPKKLTLVVTRIVFDTNICENKTVS